MRLRWALALILVVFLAGIFLVGGRALGISNVERLFQDQGYTWSHRRDAPLAAHWTGLSGPLGSAEQVSIRGTWPVSIRIKRPSVDLQTWMDHKGIGGGGGPSMPVLVEVEDMTVRWGERVLLSGLSGPLRPVPDLTGPDGTLRLERDEDGERVIVGTAKVPLVLPEIQGTARVSVRVTDTIQAEIEIPDAVLSHPLIAADPLPPLPMKLQMSWTRKGQALTVNGELGKVGFSASGTAGFSPLTLAVDVKIPQTELQHVVALFGSAIPEAEGARFNGSLGLHAQVEGPPWKVDPAPSAQDLSATGLLPKGFKRQVIQWKARDADGHPQFRQTGPMHPGWTPLSDAGWVPMAVVAAEDGAFHRHPGYDLGAIREALSQAKAGERLRGGSTLTQQLAKNLFLSGERTLIRKLRELLYALDLEASMSKPAILALYLNVVEFGPGIHGIHQAADAYFLKRPDGLTLTEAAWLAGVLPGPRTAHTRAKAGRARRARVRTILDRMASRGQITKARLEAAKTAPLRFVLE